MRDTNARLLEFLIEESVEDSMGIYCAAVIEADGTRKERTQWQEGWNAYSTEIQKRKTGVHTWFAGLDPVKRVMFSEMLMAGDASIQPTETGFAFFFNNSDLFAWGYSSQEEITDEILQPLYEAWKKNSNSGMCVYWCKHENEKPQWPVERQWRELDIWDAELETLPECKYDESIGRWKDHSKADAIANIGKEIK